MTRMFFREKFRIPHKGEISFFRPRFRVNVHTVIKSYRENRKINIFDTTPARTDQMVVSFTHKSSGKQTQSFYRDSVMGVIFVL